MKVTELKNEGLSKSYKIVIPSKTIDKAIEERIFKDLELANDNAEQFVYKKFIEPKEKAEADKKIAKEIILNVDNSGFFFF